MWTTIKTTRNLLIAEAWKELFEEEGIPCQLHWPNPLLRGDTEATCHVLIPNDRLHVAERTLRDA
jgi:hypothetical protein